MSSSSELHRDVAAARTDNRRLAALLSEAPAIKWPDTAILGGYHWCQHQKVVRRTNFAGYAEDKTVTVPGPMCWDRH